MSRRKGKAERKAIDKNSGLPHTQSILQLSSNNEPAGFVLGSLVDLRKGDSAVLDRIDLPTDDARRLMELGFLPGTRIVAGHSAPGGDPRVFQVDGSEIALRRETAGKMKTRPESGHTNVRKSLRNR